MYTQNSKVYHYTTVFCLWSILKSGAILKSTDYVPRTEAQVVWFSTNPFWEETANKSYLDIISGKIRSGDKYGTYQYGSGLTRIEVHPEAAPFNWKVYQKTSKLPKKLLKGLLNAAQGVGADYREWRISLDPVVDKDWLNLEVFNWGKQIWENSSKL